MTINEGVRFGIEGGLVRIGAAVIINEYALFWQVDGAFLEISDEVYIGPHCVIDSTGGAHYRPQNAYWARSADP